MDKFIDTDEPSKLNQEDTSNVNRSLTSNDTEAVVKPLSIKEAPGLSESLLNSFFKTNTNPPQTASPDRKGKNNRELIQQSQYCSVTKTGKSTMKK